MAIAALGLGLGLAQQVISLPYTSAYAHPRQPCYLGYTAPLTAFSCGGRIPDVGLPHYWDARMQHSQSRQPALPGVTTAVAQESASIN